jgi:hypothetical protein
LQIDASYTVITAITERKEKGILAIIAMIYISTFETSDTMDVLITILTCSIESSVDIIYRPYRNDAIETVLSPSSSIHEITRLGEYSVIAIFTILHTGNYVQ